MARRSSNPERRISGTGTYTVMTQIAAEASACPCSLVRFELGDTTLPEAPVSGRLDDRCERRPAVLGACKALREKLIAARGQQMPRFACSTAADRQQITIENGWLVCRGDQAASRWRRSVSSPRARTRICRPRAKLQPGEDEKLACRSFGAVFAEVRVHEHDRRDPSSSHRRGVQRGTPDECEDRAAASSRAGIVWGVGQALFEESLLDRALRPLRQRQPRRVPRAGERRYAIDRSRHSSRKTMTVFNPLGRAGHRRDRHHRRARRSSPTRHATLPESAFAICRSRWTSCLARVSFLQKERRRTPRRHFS